MTIAQTLTLVIGALFVAAFIYKLNDVRRDPTNIGAWAVLVILFALAIATTIRDGAPAAFGAYGVDTIGVLVRNIAQVVGFAGLQLWHLRNVSNVSKRRLVLEGIALGGTVVAMCVTTAILPSGVGLTWSNENLEHFEVLTFYYIAGAYIIYCLGSQLYWNVRFAIQFRQLLLKASAVITALGDFFLICTQLSRQASHTYNHFVSGQRPRLTTILELSFVAAGMPLLIVGLLLPPIAGLVGSALSLVRVVFRYRTLRHLHNAVKWAYPGLIRPRAPGARGSVRPSGPDLRMPVQAVRLAYTERLQQCRDGYARSRNSSSEGGRPAALAEALHSLPADGSNVDLSDERQQVAHLLAVSRALKRSGPIYARSGG